MRSPSTPRRLLRDRSGAVLVETALAVSLVLAPVAFATMDLGMVLMRRAALDQALQAGLFYAWSQDGSASTANVQSAALGGYGGSGAPTATASYTTYCVVQAAGHSIADLPSLGTCVGGTVAETYLSLTVADTVALPFPVPFLPTSYQLTSAGAARVL